jgi:glucose dehydrogenase
MCDERLRHFGRSSPLTRRRERRRPRARLGLSLQPAGPPAHHGTERVRDGNESWRDRTGNNVWTVALTVDETAGLVYMPVSTPGANYYGGDRPDNNEPANSIVALDALTLPEGKQNVGSPGYGGPIVTAGGLVFIGATADQRFRAFDARTGDELWAYALPYQITAIPMSFEGADGRQYVAVTSARAAGGAPGDEGLYVFALARSPIVR